MIIIITMIICSAGFVLWKFIIIMHLCMPFCKIKNSRYLNDYKCMDEIGAYVHTYHSNPFHTLSRLL